MAILNVKVADLPESDVVPAGQYHVRIDEVEGPEEDKNGDEYIKITYTITDGEHINRKLFDNYVILHGKAKLRKILKACLFDGDVLADTEELVGAELDVVASVTKDDKYGEQNKVTMYIIPGQAVPAGAGGGRKGFIKGQV